MKALSAIAMVLWMLVSSIPALALDGGHDFDSQDQEALYQRLTLELRCLVCQNQNLADSNAELATDLRNKAAEMVKQGSSYQEIIDYMVARYGDFVIYRPPLKTKTLLLWAGPFVLLLFVVLLAWRRIRSHPKQTAVSQFTDDELHSARSMTAGSVDNTPRDS